MSGSCVSVPLGNNLLTSKRGKKSKHCRLCDKCVSTFDHHCKWLNNCVGEKNYKPFMVFVGTLFPTAIFHGVVGLYLVIDFAADTHKPKRIECLGILIIIIISYNCNVVNDIYNGLDPVGYITIVALFVLLSVPAIFLIGQLLFLHISLSN